MSTAKRTYDDVDGGITSFQVMVQMSIGEVTIDPYGSGPSPREAAFMLIARHGEEGRYEFPMEDKICQVHVDHIG